MSGIAGICHLPPVAAERAEVEAMAAALRRRGPDAGGVYCRGGVGLGCRRLAVIDAAGDAATPIANEDGSVVLVCDGTIYNYRELASELAFRGHTLRGRGDAEVVVHAWEEHGPACLGRLRGAFALALWDAGREELLLARDRLGEKPLFYAVGRERLVFASEIEALRGVPGVDLEVDLQALGEYAAYGAGLGERTIHRGVRRLPPAHTLRLSLAGQSLEPRLERWWAVAARPEEETGEGEWLERLDAALAEAVRLRLVADAPLGALLSGGLGSALVVSQMARASTAPVRTFSVAARGSESDETETARAVAEGLDAEHARLEVEPAATDEMLEALVEIYGEPFGDESAPRTIQLARAASGAMRVALTGDGGGEVFLGERRYADARALARWSGPLGDRGRAALGRLVRRLPVSARLRRPLAGVALTGFERYRHLRGWTDERLELLRPEVRAELEPPSRGGLAAAWRRSEGAGELDRHALADLETALPDGTLVRLDRASMGHALELRAPLLDHRVVEVAAQMPARFKLEGRTGRSVLRKLLLRHLPRAPAGRAERGRGPAPGGWLRSGLTGSFERMVVDGSSPMWRYWDREAVAWRLERHLAGGAGLGTGLWRALVFHRWAERHLA